MVACTMHRREVLFLKSYLDLHQELARNEQRERRRTRYHKKEPEKLDTHGEENRNTRDCEEPALDEVG